MMMRDIGDKEIGFDYEQGDRICCWRYEGDYYFPGAHTE